MRTHRNEDRVEAAFAPLGLEIFDAMPRHDPDAKLGEARDLSVEDARGSR